MGLEEAHLGLPGECDRAGDSRSWPDGKGVEGLGDGGL